MGAVARNKEDRARRDRVDVHERVEVHELRITTKSWMRSQLWRATLRRKLTSRSAVEVIKLALDRVRLCDQLMLGATGVSGLAAGELDITLFRRLGDDLLPLFQRKR